MVENKQAIPDRFAPIFRIIGALNWPGEKRSPRKEAEIWIQDAIEKRTIAVAGKKLEDRLASGSPENLQDR